MLRLFKTQSRSTWIQCILPMSILIRIKLVIDHEHSLRGEDCIVSMDIWRDLAKNPDPPWVFQNKSADFVDRLYLVPLFVYLKYLPKNETEYYRFAMPEPVKIYLSNIWVRKKQIKEDEPLKTNNKLYYFLLFGMLHFTNFFLCFLSGVQIDFSTGEARSFN